jgi:hypothetical protein
MSPALVQADSLPINQVRQNADTHVLALELIVFVNDRQDATHPASAAVPAVAQANPIASMLHEDERRLAGPFLQTVSSDRMGWVSTPTAPRDRT